MFFFVVILFRFNLDFICKRHKNVVIKFLIAEDKWYVEKKGKNVMIKYKKKRRTQMKRTRPPTETTSETNKKETEFREME